MDLTKTSDPQSEGLQDKPEDEPKRRKGKGGVGASTGGLQPWWRCLRRILSFSLLSTRTFLP
ncbi:putative period circadian protein-like protein 2 [Sesbania bispinosa]|nr:putative period circadian protein-like protein 2 [Sesbania bispinosa]